MRQETKNPMQKLLNYRQGDISLIGISKFPKGLKSSKTETILQNGSGGNPHSFKGGIFYPHIEGDFIIGYLKAKGTKIYHVEHSPKGDKIDDGLYEIRRQVESTIGGLKAVID